MKVVPRQNYQGKSIKWDIVGLFSAVIPLSGTVILFLLGWDYESNWYSYFGMNIDQVNVSLQQVMLHGVPAILYTLYYLSGSMVIFFIIRAFGTFSRNVGVASDRLLAPMIKPFTRNEWGIIFIGSLMLMELSVVLYFGLLFSNFQLFARLRSASNFLIDSKLIPSEGNYLGIGLAGILLSLFMLFYLKMILEMNSTTRSIKILILRFLRKFGKGMGRYGKDTKKEDIDELPKPLFLKELGVFSNVNKWVWISLFCFIYFLHMMSISASIAYSDATGGKMGFGRFIPEVFILTPRRLSALSDLEKSCDAKENCIYGPFGLIFDDQNSFYLVKWNEIAPGVFPVNPGLYIVPRSEPDGAYMIMPAQILTKSALPTSSQP